MRRNLAVNASFGRFLDAHHVCLAERRQDFPEEHELSWAGPPEPPQGAVQRRRSHERRRRSQKTGVAGTHGGQGVAVPTQHGQKLRRQAFPSLLQRGQKVRKEVLGGHRRRIPAQRGEDDTFHVLMEARQEKIRRRKEDFY